MVDGSGTEAVAAAARAEAMASNLLSMQQRSDSFTRRTHMRTLERTNKALSDAINLRAIFYDVTKLIDRITRIWGSGSTAVRANSERLKTSSFYKKVALLYSFYQFLAKKRQAKIKYDLHFKFTTTTATDKLAKQTYLMF